ncbi:MAG: MFS transporter [Solirubrobacteraceae bacterium]|nr:MFS transporter [Solirubrobacteraceae bacterium]
MSSVARSSGHIPGTPYAPRWLLLLAVSMSAFITGLDNTILNIALPALQDDFDLSLSGLQWVGTSYILAFSSLLMVGGRLTDLFGRRRVLEAGMAIFTVASVLAGIAPTGNTLIAARVLQGVGGALVLPSTLTVIGSDLEEKDRQLGIGIWTGSIASAIALGPVVGGGIIEIAHWSWVFFINLPIGIVAIILVRMTVQPQDVVLPPRKELIARFDVPGLVTSSLALMSFTFVLVHGQEHGFGSPLVVTAIVVGLLSIITFVRTEQLTEYPLVDLSLFESKIFAGGTAAQVIWGLGINGVLFFTSLFLQQVLGLSAWEAGLFYVPLAVTIGIGVAIGNVMSNAWGANVATAIGMVLIAAGLLMGVFIDQDSPPWHFLIGLMVVGLGSGLTTPMTAAVMDEVDFEKAGGAAAVVSTAREISGVIGIAVIGAVLVVRRELAIDEGLDKTTAFVTGYHWGLYVATAVMMLGAAVSYFTLTTKQQRIDLYAERKRIADEELAAAEAAGMTVDHHDEERVIDATTPADAAIAVAEALHAAEEIHAEHQHAESQTSTRR